MELVGKEVELVRNSGEARRRSDVNDFLQRQQPPDFLLSLFFRYLEASTGQGAMLPDAEKEKKNRVACAGCRKIKVGGFLLFRRPPQHTFAAG